MNESNEDPYQIKDLSVQYDYLMFKIRDHVSNLSETTYRSVVAKKESIENDVFKSQLDLDTELKQADEILKQCQSLELLFMKLDQLYAFVEEFNERVHSLESAFDRIAT